MKTKKVYVYLSRYGGTICSLSDVSRRRLERFRRDDAKISGTDVSPIEAVDVPMPTRRRP